MSTKLYLTNSSSGVTLPTADAGVWNAGNTAGSANSLLGPTKLGASTTVTAVETTTTNDWDMLLRRFTSAPALRQRLLSPGGLESVTSLIFASSENVTSANMVTRARLVLLRADGSTTVQMGSLTQVITGNEWPTAVTSRTATIGPLTETLAQIGDRVVLELGTTALNTVNTSHTATLRHGGTDATDLTSGTTTGVTTRSPHLTLPDSFDVLWTVANSTMPMAGGFGGFFG